LSHLALCLVPPVVTMKLSLFFLVALQQMSNAASQQNLTSFPNGTTFAPSSSTITPKAPPNKRFVISTYGNLTCEATGFRCRYIAWEYSNITMTKGAATSLLLDNNVDYTVFTPNPALSQGLPISEISVVLQNCNRTDGSPCVADCTFGCNCELKNGQECPNLGTLAPSSATMVPTPVPANDQVCLVQNNTQLCPQMLQYVPAGQIDLMNCWNFCNGSFIGACDFGTPCNAAAYQCNASGAQGTTMGVVSGCTKALLTGQSTGGTSGVAATFSRWFLGSSAAFAAAMAYVVTL